MRKLIILSICVLMMGCIEHHDSVPPGYELICNTAGEYKWSSDTQSLSNGVSKQDAIDYAWINYNQTEYRACDEDEILVEEKKPNIDLTETVTGDVSVFQDNVIWDDYVEVHVLSFQSPDGRIANIDFGDEAVTYSGDLPVDESAKIFFDHYYGLCDYKSGRGEKEVE